MSTQTALPTTSSPVVSSPLLKSNAKGGAAAAAVQASAPVPVEKEGGAHPKASAAGGSWAQRRIVTPLMAILKSGATPEGLALSLAFGFTGGVFPVPALTTLVCCQ